MRRERERERERDRERESESEREREMERSFAISLLLNIQDTISKPPPFHHSFFPLFLSFFLSLSLSFFLSLFLFFFFLFPLAVLERYRDETHWDPFHLTLKNITPQPSIFLFGISEKRKTCF